jgi:hypothetical protein
MLTARLNTKDQYIVSIKCTYVSCVITKINKTAHGVILDVAHVARQGVLYFQNGIRFYGTCANLISFTQIKKIMAFPAPLLTNALGKYVQRPIVPKITQIGQ